MNKKNQKKPYYVGAILVVLLLVIIIGVKLYLGSYYRASETAWQCISENDQSGVAVVENEDGYAFIPNDANVGFIFYPGGKVESASYAPLMSKLAGNGILCVLLDLNGNLAFLESKAADGMMEKYPQVEEWYIGGHSLGGVVAASYAMKHEDEFEGIVFMASYPSSDISETSLKVLSIYGDQDEVVGADKYVKVKKKQPKSTREVVVKGGCHAYFGDYGEQSGDGEPTISREEQEDITVQEIVDFVGLD